MVNGTVDKNNICSHPKPDEESVKNSRKSKVDVVPSSSTDFVVPSSRESSNSEVSLENGKEKTGVEEHKVGSRTMADVPTKTSLCCSVPLNKIRSVLSNAGPKVEEDESASKLRQISRKLLCLYCDRTFVSSNLRQKHVERCHSEKQSRRLSSRKLQSQFTTTACFHCDKLPVEHSLRQLFEHLISAHSQKYFGCLLCEERFLNQIQLKDHNAKLHNSSKKQQQKSHLLNVSEESEKSDKVNKASNGNTEESMDKQQKSAKNKVKKKSQTTNSKQPPRQLRNKKKVSIKASKVGLKRSKRLQSAQNKVPVRKKKTKTVGTSKSEESNSKISEKAKSSSINPYPEFDSYYRVKKITDHSIDNLKISSLTFDDVFDKAFFNRIKCNIQENLLYHLDGKLFKNEESESRISNFEKNPPAQEVSNTTSENFGCDLSLNAITPVTSILTANFGEDLESQIEYGSKPSKKKLQIRQDPVRHKYVTRRKYQASILEHKENRDLSKLDMWTQLVIKDRQQKVLNGKKSAKEMLEYTTCAEYKLKIQRNELNRILDRRGPFEDLREEASKKAALEQLNSEFHNEISEECFKEVRSLMEDLLTEVVKICSKDEEVSDDIVAHIESTEYPEKPVIPDLPDYLNLRRTSSVPSEEEIDQSDKIALICSSQETENYELPTNTVRNKNEMVELSGEWARSRIYVCAACGLKLSNMKFLIDHKSMYHQNSWVQHYELVGNQSELYRHLCIPGLGKVGYIEKTVSCKSWLKSDSRECTKCGKVCNSLSELHRHILECGGDWTWMLARKKCKYRPFGARKKRRGLVKRIRVSNQKTDQTEKKKYKKRFEGPRQRPSDADTIQRMLANLPPKRSSRKSICMKDGFPRNRQKSPKNKKQVMKCGKIVRHKSTYDTSLETTKNSSNRNNVSVRHTLRSISRTLSSKILDTTSKLKVKRQLIQSINRRSPRKNSKKASEVVKNEENEEKNQNEIENNTNNGKHKKKVNIDKVKSVHKEKVNIKSFFPVSKRKASKNIAKTTEISNSDSLQPAQNIEVKEDTDKPNHKPVNVINLIKKSLNLHKKKNTNSKNDQNIGGKSEPIVVIEKLPSEHSERKPLPTSKKAPNKRKLRSSFRKVIDKVKKLKLDNTSALVPSDNNKEINIKPANSFLGPGAREKEKLATVLVPLVEELKESPLSNLAFVQNAMDNNSPTEESLIPENIFNLQHNSEDLLQAKSPLETPTNEGKRNEANKYYSTMSAKISNILESTKEPNRKSVEIEIKDYVIQTSQSTNDAPEVKYENDASQKKEMDLLSIETTAKSDKSPLISPILSPSMLSPKMKGKLRKPNRGLNDCIAMLTKKAFEENHKTEVVPDPVNVIEKPSCWDNTNIAHRIIRANECILKIPVIEGNSQTQTEVLDLSKPRKKVVSTNIPERNNVDLSIKSMSLWNPVSDILCNNQTDDSRIVWPLSSSNTIVNSNIEKAILKIPKFVEISRSNNVDNTIQGVIENYDEPIPKSETIKPNLKLPSVAVLNSVDKIIEEVVKGNLTLPSNEEDFSLKTKSTVDTGIVQTGNIAAVNTSSKIKKASRNDKQGNKSSSKDKMFLNPTNISSQLNDNSENSNTLHKEVRTSDVPQLISTSVPLVELINMNPNSAHFSQSVLPEKSQKDEESNSGVVLSENKIPSNSEIADVKNLNSVPDITSVRKKPGKKAAQGKKGILKKSLKIPDAINTNLEELKIDAEININNSIKISTLPQTNEPDILEDKKIPVKDDKIMLACDISSTKPILLTDSEVISESSKSLEDNSFIPHQLEHSSKENTISTEESYGNKLKNIKPMPSVDDDKSAVNVDANSEEKNFKSTATDSEDELPLLILKGRNKKYSLQEIPEALEEPIEGEITCENHANILGPQKSEELNTDNCKNKNIKATEIIRNAIPMNRLTTGEFQFSTEMEGLSSSSSTKHSETGPLNAMDKRKSPRKTSESCVPNKHEKNSKKSIKRDKSKHSSKIESIKNLVEAIEKEEVLGNISNTIDLKSSEECCPDISEIDNLSKEQRSEPSFPVATEALEKSCKLTQECFADSSDNEVFKRISVERNLSLKPDTIETPKKPKNFLVDSSVCNFRSNIKNARATSLKKSKKKNKNKHDSIKTKLIFKFPKIILKEPVLRIPPRDNVPERMNNSNFENKTENFQDKSINIMLDNPFQSNKVQEEKNLPVSSIPGKLEKSTENGTSLKTKSLNKKKSNKHKKKILKSLGTGENVCEARSDQLDDASPEKTISSTFLNPSVNENSNSEQENIRSLPEDSNILSASTHSTSISSDLLSESSELQNNAREPTETTLKLPSLKLQPNSMKKSKSKNIKKKKDKTRKSTLASDTIHIGCKIQANNVSNTEDSDILISENITKFKESEDLSATRLVENIEYVAEELPSKRENNSKFETKRDKFIDISTPSSEKPPKTSTTTPRIDTEDILQEQSCASQLLIEGSNDKIDMENERNTLIKSGRSLRSTVKITYKQSNIFALQIEDKEISDLKIIENSKHLESHKVSSNEMLPIQGINQNASEESNHPQQQSAKSISDYDSFEQEVKTTLNKKIMNSKKICQEVLTQNENIDEYLRNTSKQIINLKKSDEYDDISPEGHSKFKLLEMQECKLEKEVRMKSKKLRKLLKAKKVENSISEINSTIFTESISVTGTNYNKEVENECLDNINVESEILRQIVDVSRTELLKENIFEEKVKDEDFSIGSKISIETHEESDIVTLGKNEDLSLSEGELVINENFENIESNIFEEASDSDKKLKIATPEVDNLLQINVQRNFNSSLDTVEQTKSQRNKKHKKQRSSKSSKKSNIINRGLKKNDFDNENEISSVESNDAPLSGTLEAKLELTIGINESTDSNLMQIDITENTASSCSNEKVLEETKDEFEFEEDKEQLDNFKSEIKNTKIKRAPCQDLIKESISLCNEKLETLTSIFPSSTDNMQTLSLDTNNGRRKRTAKSKALESIIISEKKLDQILDIELRNTERPFVSLKFKNNIAKRKESVTESTIPENDVKEIIQLEPLEDETFSVRSRGTSKRKSRAAKSKAIENIKVSEIKSNDTEGINENEKKIYISDGNEKVRKNCKSKETNVEGNVKDQLNSQFSGTNSAQEQPIKNEITSAPTKIPLLSAGVLSTSIDKCCQVYKEVPTDENIIIETDDVHYNSDIQYELNSEIFEEKTKYVQVNQLAELDPIFKTCKKDERIASAKRNKFPKSKVLRHTNKKKEKNTEVKNNIAIDTMPKMDQNTHSTSNIESYSLTNLFSEETNLNIFQKRKRNDNILGGIEITNDMDCYDIDNTDKDNMDSKNSSVPPFKKKQKPIKNDKKAHTDDTEENHFNASIEEVYTEKIRTAKVEELEQILDASNGTGITETEQVDSLDVTLKTTADEISSILMEDSYISEIPCSTKMNNFRETFFHHLNTSSESGIIRNDKIHEELNSTQRVHEFLDKTTKKKKNRYSTENSATTGSEKASNIEMGAIVETDSKRRSRRACKVNTYNENYLAEAIFEQAVSEKEKADKKKADVNTDCSSSGPSKNADFNEVSPEKKLNSDELFDLLKTTAPDNLIALKPVEENPSDTPNTDDNFDDEFDDILRKSQALFGEKPYKKLDDICRSDDSSSTSKLTDFERLDENTESNFTLRKSIDNYISETTFSNSIISVCEKETKKPEEPTNSQLDDIYCDVCRKSFKRIDNLIKHRTTLTHIAKLSEMEAKEAHKLKSEVQDIKDSCSLNIVTDDTKMRNESDNYSYPTNSGNNALKIAEIITEALEKRESHTNGGFSEVVAPLSEYRRYKSLGERKSFEYDQGSPNVSDNIDANPYESNISNNTGVILEKQITLLQNIVGLDCGNDISTSSYHSLVNSIGQDSPVSVFSSKLEDSTNFVFPNDLDLDDETGRTSKAEDFLKPPQIEDISEDSINLRNSEDVKSRKVLNRDEELFLECCSLLKSGSEVSNFSKKSNRNSLLNNVSIKMPDEPDVLESKNIVSKVTEDSSDYSRRATPLGDSFGDTSNSNTISSSWEINKNGHSIKNVENFFNFSENEKYIGNNEGSFHSKKFNNFVATDAVKSYPTKNRKSTSVPNDSSKKGGSPNKPSSKMPTKGALKIFEGLKVSIPTDDLNLEILKKRFVTKKSEKNISPKASSEKQFLSPKTPRRKSKPVKNKPQIDDRFIFKVNKKPPSKDTEEAKSNVPQKSISDKITDVYDFEETQDNTDVFAKPDFKSFRAKGTEITKGEIRLDNNYEVHTMSSSSSSNLSGKKTNECITKKKHMIMGRIFKNAVKPKLDEEIRDIPPIDHNELVENYVMSCTPKPEEEFKKPKMTEEEMNYLFDKLLDKPIEQPKKSGSPSKADCKNTGMRKKLKMKCKKRQRSNSDSTDDEFGLNKIVKKRPGRKNAREEDNSINLEQELKECIGVASRKSQRKCTSGKQNVLVEYWSSDESAFETFLENHLQELSEKSDIPIPKDQIDEQEEPVKLPSILRENPPKNSTCEKIRKPKTKSKILRKKESIKGPTTSNEIFESSVQTNRRKRTAAHPLYHWSSSSEDELHDLIEVKSIRDDPEDEYDEERPVQHGWIVGDSPKKLVTMLAQAKGKKTEPESFVKEQGKKKNSNS